MQGLRASAAEAAFQLSSKQYSDLYCDVYSMATTYKKGHCVEQQEAILKFAVDPNKELAIRYSADEDLVRKALAHVFKFIDRVYLCRMAHANHLTQM